MMYYMCCVSWYGIASCPVLAPITGRRLALDRCEGTYIHTHTTHGRGGIRSMTSHCEPQSHMGNWVTAKMQFYVYNTVTEYIRQICPLVFMSHNCSLCDDMFIFYNNTPHGGHDANKYKRLQTPLIGNREGHTMSMHWPPSRRPSARSYWPSSAAIPGSAEPGSRQAVDRTLLQFGTPRKNQNHSLHFAIHAFTPHLHYIHDLSQYASHRLYNIVQVCNERWAQYINCDKTRQCRLSCCTHVPLPPCAYTPHSYGIINSDI